MAERDGEGTGQQEACDRGGQFRQDGKDDHRRPKRLRKHPEYGKYIYRSTKYAAHDEKNEARTGDLVEIVETRPTSKRKRWRLVKILERRDA